jgi:hypothetical protein
MTHPQVKKLRARELSFKAVERTGHFRILRTGKILDEIVKFMGG